ncbi:chromosome partitioning protein [Streptomyces sp. KhCrAH-43]|uniref:ParA family protein n=1 Tax=unclassified Streptomyces TaxID=2593676 RepID=UPI00035C39DB|nr:MULTISPECIES: ParA family protein [unclassified Streptomyces]MYS32909.1 AAA family ATPase [Streptomyces sp. SID4920]MYX64300.1 AAA family ATPase [Streptomyces sp. SID8373]RAJ47868.1 chromosome partitioning protein [Streptomyces sp. KhCrAH-43]
MTPQIEPGDRQKVTFKLSSALKAELKIRAAELRIDIQDAVATAMTEWQSAPRDAIEPVDTAGARAFATWLTEAATNRFKAECSAREISYVQGLTQSVSLWLLTHPSPRQRLPRPATTRRIIMANQKGGVGKTAVAGGVGAAAAEDRELARLAGGISGLDAVLTGKECAIQESGDEPPVEVDETYDAPELRVLLVDYDPQGHLSKQLGIKPLPADAPSLAKFMARQATGDIRDLIVPIQESRFGGRLDLLPACQDAFLLDVMISTSRNRQAALEQALEPLEQHYDVIIIDCPPSLGMGMDAAIYYSRHREGEREGDSGIVIVVQAEDSSADAYDLLVSQINDGVTDWRISTSYLGIVVNLYDARDGHVITSSLAAWHSLGEPRVIGVVPRRKEQREAARTRRPLLAYDPSCAQSRVMRHILKEISS